MTSADLPRILPFAIPLLVVAAILLRARKPKRIYVGKLWIGPLCATLGISMGLWFTPHPPFGILQYAAMALAAGLGVAAGTARAHTLRLWREPETGHMLAQASPVALLAIIVLVGVRMAVRQTGGIDPGGIDPGSSTPGLWAATIIDASMLFALGMVISQQFMLWRRIGALPA